MRKLSLCISLAGYRFTSSLSWMPAGEGVSGCGSHMLRCLRMPYGHGGKIPMIENAVLKILSA